MKLYWTLIRIAYLGKSYHGSQIQPNIETVGRILTEKLTECGASNPQFASRTDKGVSAIGNVILTSSEMNCELLAGKLTEKLSGHDVWINGFCEVKENFKRKFIQKDKKNYIFFKNKKNKLYFDLTSYIYASLKAIKVKNIDVLKIDTFDVKNKFFSARRALKLKHNDYGRNISIIMLN